MTKHDHGQWFYESQNGMTQADIARKYGVSQPYVSLMLKKFKSADNESREVNRSSESEKAMQEIVDHIREGNYSLAVECIQRYPMVGLCLDTRIIVKEMREHRRTGDSIR